MCRSNRNNRNLFNYKEQSDVTTGKQIELDTSILREKRTLKDNIVWVFTPMWNLEWCRAHQSKNLTIQELEKDKIKKENQEGRGEKRKQQKRLK